MRRSIPERSRDVALVLVVAAVSLPGAIRLDVGDPRVVPPAAVAAIALLARRRRPVAVLAVIVVAHAIAMSAGSGDVLPAFAVALFTVGMLAARSRALAAAALSILVALAAALLDSSGRAYSSVAAVIFLAGAWVVGDNARIRREREHDLARTAVADERARIARELHDVVTHNVSVMVVQAAAGNDVFDARPDQAREALAAVEETGRRALNELRSLLDVVATDDAPQPGLAQLDALLDHVGKGGVPVSLTIEGTPRELPANVDVSAYRIVQEALTNVLKHARASRADVRVRYRSGEVEIEVRDDGVGTSSAAEGRGLLGMRERVALLNGELVTRTEKGAGFAICATLPERST